MRGRLIGVRDLSGAERSSWRSLGERAVEPNPMSEVDFVVSATNHLPGDSDISVVVAEDADGWFGAMPVRPAPRLGNIPIPAMTTNIRRMTYLGTPLLDRTRGPEAARTLLTTLAEHRRAGGFKTLVVEWLGDNGPVASMLRGAADELGFPIFVYEEFEQPFLTRRPLPTYSDNQSTKHRKDYERRARRLSESLGAPLEVVDRAGDSAAVDEFIALEAAGYKSDNGVAMVTRPGEPEYFHEMCARYAALGRLHLLELRAAERLVATQISVESGDGLFLVKVSHDEAFARSDPGVQLHFRAMEHFHHRTAAQFIRVCTFPGNELLLRLYPERRLTSTWMIGLGGRLDRAVLRALPGARALVRRARQRRARSSVPA